MPKFLPARAPHDDGEAGKIRRLAGARHAPADWIERAQIVALSWDGLGAAAVAARAGCHDWPGAPVAAPVQRRRDRRAG